MGTGSYLWVKRPGRGADHPPQSKYRGDESAGLYLYSSSGPQWTVKGKPSPLHLLYIYPTFEPNVVMHFLFPLSVSYITKSHCSTLSDLSLSCGLCALFCF